ncbi:hypothetical protein HPP92_024473 [Vanilla planifolia]|uniref:Uncharacterized protein n=1 Tax=Vanilla planifolia TaxID=51239 RepID=A0A835UD04_VANPL|nr:hypothetical protein HPP92_024473 [Vanilla planifolia]
MLIYSSSPIHPRHLSVDGARLFFNAPPALHSRNPSYDRLGRPPPTSSFTGSPVDLRDFNVSFAPRISPSDTGLLPHKGRGTFANSLTAPGLIPAKVSERFHRQEP